MANNQDALLKYWNQFIQTGVIHENVREYIAQGWKRCRKMNIDHEIGVGTPIAADAFKKIQENNL